MRDIVVTLLVVGSIPFIFRRPYIGILVWAWLGYMNPHRLSWGFAYDFQFAQIIAIVTLIAMVFSREKKRLPLSGLTVLWLLWIFWMNVTTLFALNPDEAFGEWDRTMKIQLISLVSVVLINSRARLELLVVVIAVSIGFFGVKGGIFSVLTDGNYMVWGPPDSFIDGNNSLGLALVMTMPLMWYIRMSTDNVWIKWGVVVAMGLTGLAILTTHSRGALLAIGAMLLALVFRTQHKFRFAAVLLIAIPIFWSAMPEHWHQRMATIVEYEEDTSAMGRINAWGFAFRLAQERPIVGGGFDAFTPELFWRYAPDPEDFHDSHSIYFEVLGEHGFVGLALYLLLALMTLIACSGVLRKVKSIEHLQWASQLARMVQVSLVGYAVGGAFLGLAYFDLYYHMIAITVILREIVSRELATAPRSAVAHDVPSGIKHGVT